MDVSRDTNFYYSFLVLPPDKRRAIVAVWDFCRAVDDAVDQPAAGGGAASRGHEIAWWRSELDRCYGAGRPETEQGRNLRPLIDRFGLPRQPFDDIVDGMAMDVTVRRYETFDDLHPYCLRVASAVGLVCIEIFGYRDPATRDYAIALGVALQLTNIVRDVPADLRRDRVYLPQEDLRRFGVADRDLGGGPTERVRALLAFECDRARSFYARSKKALPAGDARRLVAAEIMSGVYFAILRRIERRGYDVFSEVVRVPRPRRALIAATIWAQVMLRGVAAPLS